jgi:predicted dehydrogenase
VIGGGYWGPKLARNFHELPQTVLVAIAELEADRRDALAARFPGAAAVHNHLELLAHDSVEAVAVATPASTHFEVASAAMRAGKHVLIEKPMACSTAEADALLSTAAEHGVTLMVGHTFEYNPAVELLRDLLAAGELGDLYYVHAARLNLGIFQPDINVVWDLAPHDLSILLFLLGEMPSCVRAHGRAYVRQGIEDVAWMSLEFASGVSAHIHVSWLDPCKTRRVTLVGNRKMAVYDDVASLDKVAIYDRGVDRPPYTDTYGEFQLSYRYGDVHTPRLAWEEPLKRECAHFADSVRRGLTPRSDGQVGRRVVRVLEAASKSLKMDGAAVSLEP